MNRISPTDLVATDRVDGVETLTLGAAPAHPLSSKMIAALHAALDRAAACPDTRVIVLDGPGHIFCAGHDLKEIKRHRADADLGQAFLTELFEDCARMMVRLATFPKPTIAMVDGIAIAAGLQLAVSCDLVFASTRAQFCLPGVKNGGFCTTPAVGVSRSIGRKHLMELLLSGEVMDTDWALRAGLVNRVVDPEALAAETHAFAARLASRNPGPVAAGKSAVVEQFDLPLAEAYAKATPVMVSHFMDQGRLDLEKTSPF